MIYSKNCMQMSMFTTKPHFIFQCVPIPTIKRVCENGCCSQTYVPLITAHAFLIHEICTMKLSQDDKILCNPGSNTEESQRPGLLYACVKKAHTLGGDNPSNSSLFFTSFYEGLQEQFQSISLKQQQLKTSWKDCLERAVNPTLQTYDTQQTINRMATWTYQQLTQQQQNFIDHYTHNADI